MFCIRRLSHSEFIERMCMLRRILRRLLHIAVSPVCIILRYLCHLCHQLRNTSHMSNIYILYLSTYLPTYKLTCSLNRITPPNCTCDTSNQYWLNGSTCEPCDSTCQTCFGYSYNECLTCASPLYLDNYLCISKCTFFELWGDTINSESECENRCSNSLYQINSRRCCPDSTETCYNELTHTLSYPSSLANSPNSVILTFSSPFRIAYAQSYSRVFILQMENIDVFTSSFEGIDESNGYVSQVKITAVPQ